MNKYIKNVSGGNKTYQGQLIADGDYFLIPEAKKVNWAEDSTLLVDIVNADALVCNDNQASGEITDINKALNHLKDFGVIETETVEEVKSGGASNLYRGFKFTGTKNTTTTHDYKFIDDFHLHDGFLEADKFAVGDHFIGEIVDVDGVTYPAGTVLKVYISGINIPKAGCIEFSSNKKTVLNLKDYYLRVKYTSVGTVDDVEVMVNMRGFDS